MAKRKKKGAKPKVAGRKPTVYKLHDPGNAISLREGVRTILEEMGIDPSTVGAFSKPFSNDGTFDLKASGTCLGAALALWKQRPADIGQPPRRCGDETRLEITIQGAEARTVLLDLDSNKDTQEQAVLAVIAGSGKAPAAPEPADAPEPAPDLPTDDAAAVLAPTPEGEDGVAGPVCPIDPDE